MVIVTTNVLTKEFGRCFENPLETPEQQQQRQEQQQRRRCGAAVSGMEAEEHFWQQFVAKSNNNREDEIKTEMTVLQRLASVMPAEHQQQLISMIRRRNRQPQHIHLTSPAAAAPKTATTRLLCAKSPLLGVHFARIAVDEGHRLVQSGSLHVQLACTLRADKR